MKMNIKWIKKITKHCNSMLWFSLLSHYKTVFFFVCVFVGMRQRPRERASWYHPSNSGTAACWETSAASPPTCVWLPGLLCCPSPSSRCFSCTLHRCDQTVSLSLSLSTVMIASCESVLSDGSMAVSCPQPFAFICVLKRWAWFPPV